MRLVVRLMSSKVHTLSYGSRLPVATVAAAVDAAQAVAGAPLWARTSRFHWSYKKHSLTFEPAPEASTPESRIWVTLPIASRL
ncbi:unannotated protein [freshwater metagenome]|uniref:Unannotated protein n=1 Tax=freshwater metagenome TaxID=449393 RepID=A0A6J6A621_9ZZZZ